MEVSRIKEAKNSMRRKLLGLGKLMAAGRIDDPLKNFVENTPEEDNRDNWIAGEAQEEIKEIE